MSLRSVLAGATAQLAQLGARHALVGGLAVSIRTEPRFTRDVDIAVAVLDDDEAESLVRALSANGYEVAAAVEQEATNRLATVRLRPSSLGGGAVLDLLFASSGIERDLVASAEEIEALAGVVLPVARLGHLVALKLLARDDRRPQDEGDLRALLDAADEDELARARAACGAIIGRGYSRGRPLLDLLEAALPESRRRR